MSMSMNLHGVSGVVLGKIRSTTYESGEPYYHREIKFFDKNGESLLSITQFSDDGYKLLVVDSELAEMNAELPLLKAA